MKKKLILFITVLALLLCTALPVLADDTAATGAAPTARVIDSADLLTDEEEQQLEAKLTEVRERQKFDIVIATAASFEGKSAEAYADDLYDYSGYGVGSKHDGCLLVIRIDPTPGNSDWHISTTGYGIKALTDERISEIGSQMAGDLRAGNYKSAFETYIKLTDQYVTKTKRGKIKGFLISLAIALVIAFIVKKKIQGDYEKAVRFNADARNYLVDGSLQVVGAYENFTYSNVTQHLIEKESSGGSSTHTGSSGTTHGGGGGKF